MDWVKRYLTAFKSTGSRTQDMVLSVVTVLVAWVANSFWMHGLVVFSLAIMVISLISNWSGGKGGGHDG